MPAATDGGAQLDVRQGMRALDPQDRAVVLLVDLLGFDYVDWTPDKVIGYASRRCPTTGG